jgi:hypothetical protein
MPKPFQTPVRIAHTTLNSARDLVGADEILIAELDIVGDEELDEIVKRINLHDELVAVVGSLLGDIDYTAHACSLTAPVSAALNPATLERAQKVYKQATGVA